MNIVFDAKVYAKTNLGAWSRQEALTDLQNKLEDGKIKITIEGISEDNLLLVMEEKE